MTPTQQRILDYINEHGDVSIGTQGCGAQTATRLEEMGLVQFASFVDRRGRNRQILFPVGTRLEDTPTYKEWHA